MKTHWRFFASIRAESCIAIFVSLISPARRLAAGKYYFINSEPRKHQLGGIIRRLFEDLARLPSFIMVIKLL